MLLLGRGIQGMGCAGLNVVVRVILSDKVNLKENAKNWSIFSFTAGMSYGIGPGDWRYEVPYPIYRYTDIYISPVTSGCPSNVAQVLSPT